MDEQKLNEKLAKWVFPAAVEIEILEHTKAMWIITDEGEAKVEYFTRSLDVCDKYLITKLRRMRSWDISLESLVCFPEIYLATIKDSLNPHLDTYRGEGETLALAFCLALEKIVDKLVDAGGS